MSGLSSLDAAGARRMVVRAGVAVVAMVACLASADRVLAAEPEPLRVTQFSMFATSGTSVTPLKPGGNVEAPDELLSIVNEPYPDGFGQAGGHPWGLTTVIDFATEEFEKKGQKTMAIRPTRDPKDIVVNLPPGLLGDPGAVPSCSLTLVKEGACPTDTQVGVFRIGLADGNEATGPIVNVTPEAGQSAEFGLQLGLKVATVITGHLVRTKQGYGLAVLSRNIPTVGLFKVELTFWGVPSDPSHDQLRGSYCSKSFLQGRVVLGCGAGLHPRPSGVRPAPFLTLSTDCSAGGEEALLRADSWEEPGTIRVNQEYEGFDEARTQLPAVTGCGALRFDPSVGVEPDTLLADEPVGLDIGLKVPLEERPEGLATPQLRDTALTLPEGLSVSPSVVDGIRACDEFGREGIDITGPESEEVGLDGELVLAAGHCPDASIVGTAEAFTPLLDEPVKGHVFLGRPACGGVGQRACTEADAHDGRLYRLYLELGGTGELGRTGIHFKVPFETHANLATGQLTSVVLNTPQAPFRELRVRLNGGPKAPLANPAACGRAYTTADFTPWSAPGITPEGLTVAGTPDATPSSFFDVSGCSSPAPFAPGFLGGMVTPQAGQFSPFTLNFSRGDREQYVKGIQVHTPPGLLGMLSNVPLCGEPQADRGTCPSASRIGTTRVATGAGSHPFEIEGEVFLTGPYGGDPFGLSIVVHVVAGPFNLGIKVVRARIMVDPTDSTLTVTTDETGPYAVPQIVFGVPVRLKRVTVNIDKPGFMFNPTNCSALSLTASISGTEEAIAHVSAPFAVGGCKTLAFKPRFTVSTNGHTSRSKGASLDARLSYPAGSVGNQANIARVKVSLPKQLPSYLPTLQKACLAATFQTDPASCPSGSIVGIVRASTPLLPVGLSGPVYFVSHGGEEFPSLIVVLQGYGVRVDLTGSTFIRRGITSSTFKTVPDVPVGSFELFLPQGRNHALAANGSLCKAAIAGRLVMPTEMVAQNGAVLKQNTKIAVTGCARGSKASVGRSGR